MLTKYISFLLFMSLLTLGCHPSQDHPRKKVVVPPKSKSADSSGTNQVFDYQHTIKKVDIKKHSLGKDRVLKRRIAVACFGDLIRPLGSPFSSPGIGPISGETSTTVEAGKEKLVLQQKKSVDVGFQTDPCPAFTGLLVNKLLESKRFIVIERKEINQILREQDFGRGGRVLPQTAARLQRVRGLEFIITGEVANINQTSKQNEKAQTIALLRIYDVETGEIVASSEIQADSPQQAVNLAAESIVDKVQDKPWKVKISAARSNNVIILNAGREEGIYRKDRFEIISLGPKILDPDEGTVLAREKSHMGVVEVFEVHDKYAKAQMLVIRENGVFKRGDLAVFILGPYGDDLTDYLERLNSPEFEEEL
ncbi:MAG: hypothetical protein KAJ46_01550 [Sedimentisphaerales bacterium]|nr:hypothetical protein [Sedimentisphaerales bacterium]